MFGRATITLGIGPHSSIISMFRQTIHPIRRSVTPVTSNFVSGLNIARARYAP